MLLCLLWLLWSLLSKCRGVVCVCVLLRLLWLLSLSKCGGVVFAVVVGVVVFVVVCVVVVVVLVVVVQVFSHNIPPNLMCVCRCGCCGYCG